MSWWTKKELHPKTKSKFVVVFGDVFYLPNVKSINKPAVEIETKEYRLLNHAFNYPGNAKWKPVTLKFVDMNGMGSQTEFFDTGAFLWQMLNNTGYAYPHLDTGAINEAHYKNVDTKDGKALTTGGGHHISTKISFRDDPKTPIKENNTWRTITTPEKSSNIANSFGGGLEGKIDKLPAGVGRQRVAIFQISPDEKITEAWYLVNPLVKSINWGDLSYDSDELIEYELQIVYDWAVLDRSVIGTPPTFSIKSYQEFMKTIKSNKDSIDQEMKDIERDTADQPRQEAVEKISDVATTQFNKRENKTDDALAEIGADIDRSDARNQASLGADAALINQERNKAADIPMPEKEAEVTNEDLLRAIDEEQRYKAWKAKKERENNTE